MPDAKIIAVTIHEDEPFPARLLEAGAVGYLTKGCDVREIIDAILSMLPGEESLLDALSQRELQGMIMSSQGMRTNTISEKLSLSPKTVSTYRKRLHEKLDVSNDVEMMRLAIKHGILDDTD